MKNYKKNHVLSKRLLSFTALLMLLNSTAITHAAIGERLRSGARKVGGAISKTVREKLPSVVKGATSKIKSSASAAYQKVKNYKADKLIELLLSNSAKLGGQIGRIKDCMLFQLECSATERAAFLATATTIVALTAALVGFTLTVAATSKEPDQELTAGIEQTSQEVQGWSKEDIIHRLTTTKANFEQNLHSMKNCLASRRCTKRQKRALYGSAIAIVSSAVVIGAILAGTYVYAERMKAEEEADLPGKEPIPGEVTPEDAEPRKEGLRPSFTFDETPLPEGRLSKFQRFFRSKIQIVRGKRDALQDAYQQIKEQVAQGIIRTRKRAAERFLALVTKGAQFSHTVQNVLAVDLSKLRNAIKTARSEISELKKRLSDKALRFKEGRFEAQLADFIRFMKDITDKIKFIATKGKSTTRALKRLTDIKRKSVQYFEKKAQRLEAKGELKLAKKARMKIKVKAFLKKSSLENLYTSIIQKINDLKLYQVGSFSTGVLRGLARLLDAARTIHTQAGKIGLVISQDNIQQGLLELRYALVGDRQEGVGGLAATLQQALRNKPLIVTNQLGPVDLIKSLVKAAITTEKFGFLRENFRDIFSMAKTLKELDDLTDGMEEKVDQFTRDIAIIRESAQKHFVEKIKAKPIRNIPNAASILRNALEQAVEKGRNAFDSLMTDGMNVLIKVQKATPSIFTVFKNLNGYLEKATGKPFINDALLQDVTPILTNSVPNIAEGAKKLISKVEIMPAA